MKAETFVLAGGVFNAGVGVFHLFFWRLFRWREAVARLDRVNGAVL